VALTAVVFVGTPRLEAGAFGRGTNMENISIGLPDDVNLSAGGNLQQTGTAVMIARFPDEPGGQYPGELLWRSTALESYTGNGWSREGFAAGQWQSDSAARSEYMRTHDGALSRLGGPRRGSRLVRQIIYM